MDDTTKYFDWLYSELDLKSRVPGYLALMFKFKELDHLHARAVYLTWCEEAGIE